MLDTVLDKVMETELLKNCIITRVSNAAGSGTSTITSSVLDMSGFDAVAFIAMLNTVVDGSVLNLTVKENTANSTSSPTPTAVTGGSTGDVTASTDSNHVLVSDVIRPGKRFVFCTLARGTNNASVDGILALQYRSRANPVTQPTTVIGSTLSTPEA